MKSKDGIALLHDLVRQSDILVENYLPGKLASMGLGYEELSKINPKLIYASITGYGQDGPYADRPGYDVIIEVIYIYIINYNKKIYSLAFFFLLLLLSY